MNHKIEIIERYKPKYSEYKYRTGISYKDILEIVDTVYILNIDGKDNFHEYATKEEAEQAALKYNTQEFLKELQNKADLKLRELVYFKFTLSHLNQLYIFYKKKKYTASNGHEFLNKFNTENPVISLLPPQDQHKCYIALMKNALKEKIDEFYRLKKEYLGIKKEIKRLKNIG